MSELDVDDLIKFAKEQFGIRPTPLQLEMIALTAQGKKVQVMHYHRLTGKTTATKLWLEYKKYKEKQNDPTFKQDNGSTSNTGTQTELR